LLEHLGDVRDPMALPGWISVTTKNETLRLLKARSRSVQVDPLSSPILDRGTDGKASDEDLLRSERRQMVRDGLDELAPKQRALLLLLVQDPPLTYQEISRLLDIPVGSIGPTRARYLDSLRSTAAMRDYFANET
jgi:DNA-directed RNA polymerase specialized sigma24 family protein